MPTWIQDPVTHKLIPKEEYRCQAVNDAPTVIGDIEPFVSPITKKLITSRSGLRRHNSVHGVTDSRDYSPALLKKLSNERDDRMTGNTPQAKKERIAIIDQALRKQGI